MLVRGSFQTLAASRWVRSCHHRRRAHARGVWKPFGFGGSSFGRAVAMPALPELSMDRGPRNGFEVPLQRTPCDLDRQRCGGFLAVREPFQCVRCVQNAAQWFQNRVAFLILSCTVQSPPHHLTAQSHLTRLREGWRCLSRWTAGFCGPWCDRLRSRPVSSGRPTARC